MGGEVRTGLARKADIVLSVPRIAALKNGMIWLITLAAVPILLKSIRSRALKPASIGEAPALMPWANSPTRVPFSLSSLSFCRAASGFM